MREIGLGRRREELGIKKRDEACGSSPGAQLPLHLKDGSPGGRSRQLNTEVRANPRFSSLPRTHFAFRPLLRPPPAPPSVHSFRSSQLANLAVSFSVLVVRRFLRLSSPVPDSSVGILVEKSGPFFFFLLRCFQGMQSLMHVP